MPPPCAALLPFPQSPAYAAAVRGAGGQAEVLETALGPALVVQRGRVRLISRGPVWQGGTPDQQRACLRRLARWPGITIATPEGALSGIGLIPLVTPLHHAIWDIAPAPEDLRERLAGKWRNRLVAAERAGVRVTQGKARDWEALITAEVAQRHQRGYSALSPAFSAALPADSRRIWVWRQAGQMRAAMAFVVQGGTATYHLGWAEGAARAAGAHGVMLWQAALSLRAEGVRWLDLGSLNDEQAPGLAHFKRGTGAAIRPLGATLLVVPR